MTDGTDSESLPSGTRRWRVKVKRLVHGSRLLQISVAEADTEKTQIFISHEIWG